MSTLSYPYDDHPPPGTTREIVPGVRWLTMPMGGGSLNHINLYLLEDVDGWWVVDTGLNLEEVTALWDEIFRTELGGKPVIAVLCTHFHPDHIGQARRISDRFRVPLYMTHGEYYQARAFSGSGPGSDSNAWQSERFFRRAGMADETLTALRDGWKARAKNPKSDAMVIPPMPEGYVRLRDGDELP
ncbi:MAG: MBL fold metallo-hydrolase, partial [Pseudomonadota bacterium]